MSERYSRLFSLPENLYTIGSPVVIAAGALLKDNQTGKVLAQLKLTNIQYKKIKAAKVKLFPQDTMGQPLGDAVEYQYLDLQIVRDADFGSKTPILFPDATARSFVVEVTTVVFADNTVWNSDGSTWEPIPDRVALHQRYDRLVIEQLRLEQSGTCQFVVQQHKDLWLCTCGAVNHNGEVRCHDCGKQLSQIHPLDTAGLMERANARLAEEARLAAEEEAAKAAAAEAAKKKTAKILKIVIPAFCVVIAIALLMTKVIIPNGKYNDAVALMKAGQYGEAIVAFEAMDGYKDSIQKIANCEQCIIDLKFSEAEALMEAGDYDGAIAIYGSLTDYEGGNEGLAAAKEAKMSVAYKAAEILAENGETTKAAMAFYALGNYRDAKERCFGLWDTVIVEETVSAGWFHTVGVKNDGTVVAVGVTESDQCNVNSWLDIASISAGGYHTVGVRSDGTVVASGYNEYNQLDVGKWTNIKAVSAGGYHTVGLKMDGTVVATGLNEDGQCDVEDWFDIVAISTGSHHTVGLKADGTVLAIGFDNDGRTEVDDWKDIVAISEVLTTPLA